MEGKLETKSGLHGLSNFAKSLSIPYTSTNFISELIRVAGSLVESTYTSDSPIWITFLCDEIYSGGQAILVTIEAQSMMVLDIGLVEGSLKSADWEQSFNRMINNDLNPERLLKDQGKQMASAVKVLPSSTIIGADTFHAIALRLGVFHCRLKKQVEKAEQKELERAARFAKTKTYLTALKKEQEWEDAKKKTLELTDELDWFKEHYFKLIQQIRPFTSMGLIRDKTTAKLKMEEALEALELLSFPKMNEHVAYIKKLLDNGQLLHYMDQVPVLHQQLQFVLEPETSWLWMLYWQWDKKSYQTHSPKVQQRAKQEADAAKQLLQEHYQQVADNEELSKFEDIEKIVFSTLNQIVQASSLVETFNSILRPYINSARGQVSQELLNLVKFRHNHRVFKRGKRKGKAPIELLTGVELEKSWIDLLMDKVKAAFEQHQVSSLKELNLILCEEKKATIRQLEQQVAPQQPLAAAA